MYCLGRGEKLTTEKENWTGKQNMQPRKRKALLKELEGFLLELR
jgi:hypothetical protein